MNINILQIIVVAISMGAAMGAPAPVAVEDEISGYPEADW